LQRYTFNFIETPILSVIIIFIREINITSILLQDGNFIGDT